MTKYLITPNRYSRNSQKTNLPTKIILHHFENKSSAIDVRNIYENYRYGKNAVYFSTHYVVGEDGEVVLCVPENEMSYHRGNCEESGGAISIALCYKDTPGFKALASLKRLVVDIALQHKINIASDFLRYYDVSGKKNPLYFVENAGKWESLLNETVSEYCYSVLIMNNIDDICAKVAKIADVEAECVKNQLVLSKTLDSAIIMQLLCSSI